MGAGASDPRNRYALPTAPMASERARASQGLWPPKTVKKMVWDRKLGPFWPAVDEEASMPPGTVLEECPLCFLSFVGGLNATLCCNKRICSECVLQVQCPPGMPQKDCPFCLRSSFVTVFRGVLTDEEIRAEREEQLKVEQLQYQARTSETLRRLAAKSVDEKGKAEQSDSAAPSSQHQHPNQQQQVAMSSASSSGASSSSASATSSVSNSPAPPYDGHNSEEDDPDLRLAISLSLGRDW